MARVFVAVWPPGAVADALASLPRSRGADLRWVPRDDLHVTLRFLGDVDAAEVTARLAGAGLPSTTAAVGPAVSMLGRRVVVAPVAGLDGLGAAVLAATADLGRPPADRPFAGHVTLARCRDDDAGRRACGVPVELAFPVTEVAVVTSDTRPDGARYTTEATIPLG